MPNGLFGCSTIVNTPFSCWQGERSVEPSVKFAVRNHLEGLELSGLSSSILSLCDTESDSHSRKFASGVLKWLRPFCYYVVTAATAVLNESVALSSRQICLNSALPAPFVHFISALFCWQKCSAASSTLSYRSHTPSLLSVY